jgi:hypothetical protein
MRRAFLCYPHERDVGELQAYGVRFDFASIVRGPFGFSAVVEIDKDAIALIEEHDDRFAYAFESDLPTWKQRTRNIPGWPQRAAA